MEERFLIASKVKKTIVFLEKIVENFPNKEYLLKDHLLNASYELLEFTYKANLYKDSFYMKEALIKIKMIEYDIQKSLEKKFINFKKFETLGTHLLELNKMIRSWIIYEEKKKSIR